MAEASRRAATIPGTLPIHLYKNNTDNKGASYGTHENYLMRRQTPFADIVMHLTPFFVTRQIVCGAGRVGIGQDGSGPGFQISQRADFFEVEVGLETTLKRPIINTRDEPHSDADKYRRPARHHRRRQPVGDLHLSQGRHHLAHPRDDRGQGAVRRPRHRRPGQRAQGGQPRPVPAAPDPHARRPAADRAGHPVGVLRAGPGLSWTPGRAPTSTSRPPTSWSAGRACWTGSAATRCCRRRAGLGRQAPPPRGLPRARVAGLVLAQAATRGPAVFRRPRREGPLSAPRRPRFDGDAVHRGRDPARRSSSRRTTPAPTSAAGAWPNTPPRWSPRAGTRSSSTWAGSRWCGCR